VIPCYCSGGWLDELVERIHAAMGTLEGSFEILLVNDGSPDDTWRAIEELCRRSPQVRGLDLLSNVGQFRATMCGLEHAEGEIVVTMDDDLQHRPEDIPDLVGAIRADPELDCVFAPGFRYSSFRAMRRPIARALCAHRTAKPVLGPMLLQTTRRMANLEVDHEPRQHGASGYSLVRLAGIVRDKVIGASTLPLTLVSLAGLGAAALSALLGLYYLVQYWTGRIGFPGFTTQVLLIAFFGGMMLLSIGILGEYVVRILREVTGEPRYQLRRKAGPSRAAKVPSDTIRLASGPTPSRPSRNAKEASRTPIPPRLIGSMVTTQTSGTTARYAATGTSSPSAAPTSALRATEQIWTAIDHAKTPPSRIRCRPRTPSTRQALSLQAKRDESEASARRAARTQRPPAVRAPARPSTAHSISRGASMPAMPTSASSASA
jgi:dolichol-phosphate mannosyltransferase/undecaprenyl-phosphate 4-deoxy-4-formamido-L-arabinose transferase